MNLIGKMRQRVQYREPNGLRLVGGDPDYGQLITQACRYQQKTQIVKTGDGEDAVSDTVVYVVNAIATDSMVWLDGTDDATDFTEARRVLAVQESPSIDATQRLWKVFL